MIITKVSGLNDSLFGKIQSPIKKHLQEREEAYKTGSKIPFLFDVQKSSRFAEAFTTETALGNFEPSDENEGYHTKDFIEGYKSVIEPYTFKNQFAISQEMIEDSMFGKVKTRGNRFMNSYGRTREELAAAVFTNGVATSYNFGEIKPKLFDNSCADGKALFAHDHPSITGKVSGQSNLFADEFSYTTLSKMETAMQNFTDDDGHILNLQPDTIIIPNDALLKEEVFGVLNGDGNPTTADRAGNYHFGRWNVIVFPYLKNPTGLTAGKSWFMLMDSQYNKDYNGIIWMDRLDLTVKSYIDETNDANIWKGRARFVPKPHDWRCVSACIPGASNATSL